MRDQPIEPGPTALQHPRFRVIPRGSKQLVIFFSDASTPDNVFQWEQRAERIGPSVILVNNGPNEWYQGGIDGLGGSVEAVVQTFRSWADHLAAHRTYMVGTGMGGSGALLYGAKMDARVLAFAPDTRTDLPRSNVRMLMERGFTPPYQELRPLFAESRAIVDVISGENEPSDLLSAAQLTYLPGVNVISLRGVAKGPTNYLKARKRLGPILDAFLGDQPFPDLLEEGDGVLAEGYAEALHEAYDLDIRKRYADAERRSREALAVYPEGEKATALLGKAILHQGRPDEALPVLRRSVELLGTPENRHLLAACLAKTGARHEAVAVLKELISKHRRFAPAYYALGNLYEGAGSYYSAYKMMLKAANLEPDREMFAKRLAQVQKKVPA